MFGKVKTWLGIEGVKIELIIPHKISGSAKELQGKVRLSSKNTQTVTAIEIKMIEKYTRGRKDEKLTDEYLMGTIKMEKDIPFDLIVSRNRVNDFKIWLKGIY